MIEFGIVITLSNITMLEQKQNDEKKTEENSKKKIVITVAVTLLAIAVLAGLIFAIKKYNDRKKELQSLKEQMEALQKSSETSGGETTITEENGETKTPEAQTGTDEYVGWKTYTNSEIGYTLKYPADWTMEETDQFSPVREATVKYIAIDTPGKNIFSTGD